MLYVNFNNVSSPGSTGTFDRPFGQTEFLSRIETTGIETDEYRLFGTLPITRSINFRYYSHIYAWFQGKPWRITGTANYNLDIKGSSNHRCTIQGGIIIFPGVIRQSYGNTIYCCHIDCLQVLCNFFTKPVFGYNDRPIGQTFLSVRCTDKYSDASLLVNNHESFFNDCAIYSANWPAGNFSNVAVSLNGNKTNKSLAQWTSVAGSIATNVGNTFSYAFTETWPNKDAPDSAFDTLFGVDGFRLLYVNGLLGCVPSSIPSAEGLGNAAFNFYVNPINQFITKKKFGYWEYLQMIKSLFPKGSIWNFTLPFDETFQSSGASEDNVSFVTKIPASEFRDFSSSIVLGNDLYIIADTGIRLYKWNILLSDPILVSNSVDSEIKGKLLTVNGFIYCVGLFTSNVYRWDSTNLVWLKIIDGSIVGEIVDVIIYNGGLYCVKSNGNFYAGNLMTNVWALGATPGFLAGEPTNLFRYSVNSFETFYATTTVGTIDKNNGSWASAFDLGIDDFRITGYAILTGNNFLYVVSDKGELQEYSTVTLQWKKVANPYTTDSEKFILVVFNNSIYAINTRYSGSQILRWNGVDSWSRIFSSSDEFRNFFVLNNRLYSFSDKQIYVVSSSAQGSSITTIVGSWLGRLMSCFATELDRFEDDINKLRIESVPGLSINLLSDWERVAGLPDECSPLAGTISQRQQIVHAKITQSKGNFQSDFISGNQEYFIQYALSLGIVITIDEDVVGTPFRVTHKTLNVIQRVSRMPAPDGVDGSRLSSIGSLHYWVVNVLSDPFTNINTMKCVFYKIKPAHTFLSFNE